MTVWFASGNLHKKKELGLILSDLAYGLKLLSPKDAGLDFNPEETGNSYLDNAMIKAHALYCLLKEGGTSDPIIADDSGLSVDALEGRPGLFSARYGGDDLNSSQRNALVLSELGDNPQASVHGRKARFICSMVLYYSPERFFVAQETMEGEIVKNAAAARGLGGFGYDPILYIPELGRTVAELTDHEKNLLSHRGKAGRTIGRLLAQNQQ